MSWDETINVTFKGRLICRDAKAEYEDVRFAIATAIAGVMKEMKLGGYMNSVVSPGRTRESLQQWVDAVDSGKIKTIGSDYWDIKQLLELWVDTQEEVLNEQAE